VRQRDASIRHHDHQISHTLKLVFQLTHRMMTCPSKCRPLNSASTGTNGCILSSSPLTAYLQQNQVTSYSLSNFPALLT
jgi:hypothetical protein